MFSLKRKGEAKVEFIKDKKEKLELVYPCSWTYKVIGYEKEALQKAIRDVLDEREHKLTHSNASKSGKYVSMNLDMLIHNDEDRTFIFEALKNHQNVKMVL